MGASRVRGGRRETRIRRLAAVVNRRERRSRRPRRARDRGGRRGAYLRSAGRNAAAEECVAKLWTANIVRCVSGVRRRRRAVRVASGAADDTTPSVPRLSKG